MILAYESYQLQTTKVFEKVIFRPPFKPAANFDQEACFIYSLAGEGILYGGMEQSPIGSKESVLMKCGAFVNHWKTAKDTGLCEIIAIHVNPEVLQFIYERNPPDFLRNSKKANTKIFTKIPQKTIIDEYIKGLLFYFENPQLINDDLIVLKLKELILLLHQIDYPGIRELLHSLFDPVALNFKAIIQAQLYEELDIKDYAALTHMSLSTFKRRFKEIFEDTPAHYIVNKRLEKAAELLRYTDKRITDICFECGFGSLSTFSKSFSKKYRCSPTEYKRGS
ncbi:AraC family transcriptional regulator [Flagellimonas sp. DF-77]|uniref:helix-turn-helix domain-containing protein n=1 Tax=Flagellimonas algarum TaxID=3230298 RepID=UPI003394D345